MPAALDFSAHVGHDLVMPESRAHTSNSTRSHHRRAAVITFVGSDLGWYALSALATSGGFILQVSSTAARDSGVGAVVIMVGLGVGFIRYIVVRLTRLEEVIATAPATIARDPTLNAIAVQLYRELVQEHDDSAAALQRGIAIYKRRSDVLNILIKLSNAAQREIYALDFQPLATWSDDAGFHLYLKTQLARVKQDGIRVRRLRTVTPEEITDADARVRLTRFAREHEEAGAELLLCYEGHARALGLRLFFPPQGALVSDPHSRAPGCLAGTLGSDGIERATLYLRRDASLAAIIHDYEVLHSAIVDQSWNGEVWEDLARYVS